MKHTHKKHANENIGQAANEISDSFSHDSLLLRALWEFFISTTRWRCGLMKSQVHATSEVSKMTGRTMKYTHASCYLQSQTDITPFAVWLFIESSSSSSSRCPESTVCISIRNSYKVLLSEMTLEEWRWRLPVKVVSRGCECLKVSPSDGCYHP